MIFPPPLGWPHCLIFFALYHSSFGVIGQQSPIRLYFLPVHENNPVVAFVSNEIGKHKNQKELLLRDFQGNSFDL
jgi:hypothetical protein